MKKTTKLLALLASALMAMALVSCGDPTAPAEKGTSDPETGAVSTYKEYTVTTIKPAAAGQFALKLQIDNTGSKDDNGTKLTLKNLKMNIKIGEELVVVEKDSVELIPDQWDSPSYAHSNVRFVVYDGAVPEGTVVKVQLVSADCDDEVRYGTIFALQQDNGDYAMLGADSEMYKAIFDKAE